MSWKHLQYGQTFFCVYEMKACSSRNVVGLDLIWSLLSCIESVFFIHPSLLNILSNVPVSNSHSRMSWAFLGVLIMSNYKSSCGWTISCHKLIWTDFRSKGNVESVYPAWRFLLCSLQFVVSIPDIFPLSTERKKQRRHENVIAGVPDAQIWGPSERSSDVCIPIVFSLKHANKSGMLLFFQCLFHFMVSCGCFSSTSVLDCGAACQTSLRRCGRLWQCRQKTVMFMLKSSVGTCSHLFL